MLLRTYPLRTDSFRPPVIPMDAYRKDDTFTVHFDLPGVEPDSIDLTVEKDVLTVTAERSWAADDDIRVIASERRQGTYRRKLLLGEGVDADKVAADYANGVLTVTIPVAEQSKPRKVAVTAA